MGSGEFGGRTHGARKNPAGKAAEATLKETGLIYSSSSLDEVHVSDDVRFSLRYSDDDHMARELADPARPVIGIEERRVARAAARGRGSAPCHSAASAGLGRPSSPRGAHPAPARTVADAPAGHPRHRPALAPPPGHPPLDLPAPDRTSAGQRRDHRADRTARHREQQLGIQKDPRRAAQARSPGQRLHHPPGVGCQVARCPPSRAGTVVASCYLA